MVSPTFPYPLVSGGKQRLYYILKELSREFQVTLLTLAEENDGHIGREALGFLKEVIQVPIRQDRIAQIRRLAIGLPHWLFGTPAEVLVKKSPKMLEIYQRLLADGGFDLVQVEYSQYLPLVKIANRLGKKSIATAHDVSYISQRRKAAVMTGWRRFFWRREAELMRRFELTGWRSASRIVAMSENDRSEILQLVSEAAVDVVPNGVEVTSRRSYPKSDVPTLVFVGYMRHYPNLDGVEWLLKEIWPRIKARLEGVRLRIVGAGMPADLTRMTENDPQVDYLGFVDDVDEVVGTSWLSIVPLRIGSGTRLKILESMALRTAVLTTTIGCEGIDARHSVDVMLADTAESLASEASEMLRDEQALTRIADAGRELVQARYDWQIIGHKMRACAEEVISQR